jgi:hypothetical protein
MKHPLSNVSVHLTAKGDSAPHSDAETDPGLREYLYGVENDQVNVEAEWVVRHCYWDGCYSKRMS